MSHWNVLIVIGIISLFGLLAVGAIAATVYAVYLQRKYDKTVLPDLTDNTATDQVVDDYPEEDLIEQITENRFAPIDEDLALEDKESLDLMRSIERAAGIERKPKKPSGLPFRKPKEKTISNEINFEQSFEENNEGK